MVDQNSKKNAQDPKKIKFQKTHLSPKKGGRIAAAIKYDVDKDRAPKIIATGKGQVADMILQVAEEHRIPFYEDDSLVDLLSKLQLDQEVPPELYALVAEVLAFVYKLDRLAKKRKKVQQKYKKN